MGKGAEEVLPYWKEGLRERRSLLEALEGTSLGQAVEQATAFIAEALSRGRKVLLFGNGGSAADAQHAAAELVGRFRAERPPLAAIALSTDTSVLTSVGNDYGFPVIFERQVAALAEPGDVVVGISTSGESENVYRGLRRGRERGAKTVGFLGSEGGRMKRVVDVALIVPSRDVPLVQEVHRMILHIICQEVEGRLGLAEKGGGP